MVGNDMVIQAGRQPRPIRPPVYRRGYAFPNRSTVTPRQNQSYETPQPNPVQEEVASQISEQIQYVEPTPLTQPIAAASAPVETISFAAPAIEEYEVYREPLQLFTRSRILISVAVITFLAIFSVTVMERHQIISLSSHLQADAGQIIQNDFKKQPKAAVANPQQLIIHSSDYYTAMTALMTQSVIIGFGSEAHSINVDTATITGWITVKNQGALTYLTVNNGKIAQYLKQLVASAQLGGQQAVYSQSVENQIANNLLKAKGATVYLPSN